MPIPVLSDDVSEEKIIDFLETEVSSVEDIKKAIDKLNETESKIVLKATKLTKFTKKTEGI